MPDAKLAGDKTYAIISGDGAILPKAVGKVLESLLGYKHADEDCAAASLLIVDSVNPHDYANPEALSALPEYLSFFSRSLGGISLKRILYLGRLPSFSISPSERYRWLFSLPMKSYSLVRLLEWLLEKNVTDSSVSKVDLSAKDLRRTLILDGRNDVKKILPDRTKIPKLYWADDLPHFYHALLQIAVNYDSEMHSTEKELGERLGSEATFAAVLEHGRHHQKKLFLKSAQSLLESLAFGSSFYTGSDFEEKLQILVIDDNGAFPNDLRKSLGQLYNEKRVELSAWIPPGERDQALQYLRVYRSIDAGLPTPQNLQIKLQGERNPTSLEAALRRKDFILVDQLFFGHRWGPQIIKGIVRLLRDIKSRTDDNDKGKHLSEVIALSRTDDPEWIHDALRAGARAYVVKSDILRLPATLARVMDTVSEPTGTLQQNFRKLYQLPNEVVGLLRSTRIPPLRWTQFPPTSPQGTGIQDLLAAIPKTDLHVHIGSCMQPEFLVFASLLGLVGSRTCQEHLNEVRDLLAGYTGENKPADYRNPKKIPTEVLDCVKLPDSKDTITFQVAQQRNAERSLADLKTSAINRIEEYFDQGKSASGYKFLRSIIHRDLGISDYLEPDDVIKDLERKTVFEICHFVVRHSAPKLEAADKSLHNLEYADFVRIYLLCLAAQDPVSNFMFYSGHRKSDLLQWFKARGKSPDNRTWKCLHSYLYKGQWGPQRFREISWSTPSAWPNPKSNTKGFRPLSLGSDAQDKICDRLATGRLSRNLDEYLEGCELSGAEHLKHPLLMHIYAQHLMFQLIEKGILYCELRASPDGYEASDIEFSLGDACRCLVQSFTEAQGHVAEALKLARKKRNGKIKQPKGWLAAILDPNYYSFDKLVRQFKAGPRSQAGASNEGGMLDLRFPARVGLVFVGKRHKSRSEMTLEAAASAVFRERTVLRTPVISASFLEAAVRCQVVGFDLAGREVGFAPSLFSQEFQRLAQLHIPITVHAGENAPSQFVEDAILELGARRIGHGLALADDPKLMERVRDERVCLELCPVSNDQTSHFTPKGKKGREYPLRKFVEAGIPVCLNTDNPIISDTNIVKEFFQASWFWDHQRGISLWDALRLIKMGFRHAFLALPERRALLEAVDQVIFDLFSNTEVQGLLREVLEAQRSEGKGQVRATRAKD